MKQPTLALLLMLLAFVIHCEVTECYKTEVEITPAPPEEVTTKKSGWFGGIKNFFRSDTTTTTTATSTSTTTTTVAPLPPAAVAVAVAGQSTLKPSGSANTAGGGTSGAPAQKPTPFVIPHAPLMPLGPRPDTPPSSPLAGNQQQPPQWPAATGLPSTVPTHTSQQPLPGLRPSAVGGASPGTPNLPPGFAPYRPSKGTQPSGFDLSYAGGNAGGHAQHEGRPGAGLAQLTSSTSTTSTTTTTTQKPPASRPAQIGDPNVDLRGGFNSPSPIPAGDRPGSPQHKEDFPALPPPRRPSIKEDFPALPTPKTPGGASNSPTPASPLRPSSPTAWQTPLPTPAAPASGAHAPASPLRPGLSPTPARPVLPANSGGNQPGVAFVPHSPGFSSSTTVRPGFSSSGNSIATDDEIRQLTEQLYTKETNSQLNLIQVNAQGKTRSIDSADEAPQPLLSVDPKALESNTIAKLKLLFNNYEEDTLVNEHVTPNEHKEENDFLDAIMATSVMRQAMLFLQQKGLVTPDPKTHRDLVKELWFTQYSRGQGKIGSSGFEHVFVHEVKEGTIIGFHNWVYVNEEESAGRFDYKGYMNQLDLGTKGKVMKIRFSYNGLNKPVDTMFIGTSPELELALYTVCFKLRPDRTCPVSLNNSRFGIVTYSWRYRGKNLIGSAYPEI